LRSRRHKLVDGIEHPQCGRPDKTAFDVSGNGAVDDADNVGTGSTKYVVGGIKVGPLPTNRASWVTINTPP